MADRLRHRPTGRRRARDLPLAPVAVARRRHRLGHGGWGTVARRPRERRIMRAAWRVSQVRAAEEAMMKPLPNGALMQRAAAGLARRCASTLPRVYGSRVLLLVGPGNNGGDALHAGAPPAR